VPLVDIVDTKPANMEDLTEVITAAQFHPTECGLFVYSSSKGVLRLCDLRSQALCDRNAKGIGFLCLLNTMSISFKTRSSEDAEIVRHASR